MRNEDTISQLLPQGVFAKALWDKEQREGTALHKSCHAENQEGDPKAWSDKSPPQFREASERQSCIPSSVAFIMDRVTK